MTVEERASKHVSLDDIVRDQKLFWLPPLYYLYHDKRIKYSIRLKPNFN